MPSLQSRPAIILKAASQSIDGADLVLDVVLHGVALGQRVELSFVESDGTDDARVREDRVLGEASGYAAPMLASGALGFSFVPDAPPASGAGKAGGVRVAFRFPAPAPLERGGAAPPAPVFVLPLSDERADLDEGDWWEVAVRADNLGCTSPVVPLARVRRQLEDGGATYEWHDGHDLTLFHDGSTNDRGTGGAFHEIRAAIAAAQHFVFIADWSFHPLFRPTRTNPADPADSIGALLVAKATTAPGALIAVHTWDHTNMGAPDAQNDDGAATLAAIALGMGKPGHPENLLWRASSRTGVGWSHHQKFVVLDCAGEDGRRDLAVFFGGLDLTKGRFDWPAHVVKASPAAWPFLQDWGTRAGTLRTNDWYNAEFADDEGRAPTDLPRQPWHDIHGRLRGPAAWDFVREFVGRWMRDPSSAIAGSDAMGDDSTKAMAAVWDVFKKLRREKKTFVQQRDRRKGKVSAQVYRSMARAHWGPPAWAPKDDADRGAARALAWTLPTAHENSIANAHLRVIDQAESFVYIENQYLIGSGGGWGAATIRNDVPGRLVKRILERAEARKPFHVYVVTPMFPEGNPVGRAALQVRKNEWLTWQYMVKTLDARLGESWSNYLSIGFLANWSPLPRSAWSKSANRVDRVRAHQRYMVYVHSKLMIVDDRYALFGSANLNERSLAGDRDSEIACGLWPGRGHDGDVIEAIREFRLALWAEHYGGGIVGADAPGSAACTAATQARGDLNYRNFRTMAAPPVGHLCRWPFVLKKNELKVQSGMALRGAEAEKYLPDAPAETKEWAWAAPGASFTMDLAE